MSETYNRYYREHFNVHVHNRNRNYVLEENCPYCKRYRGWLYYNDLVRNENSTNPISEVRNLEGILQITGMNIIYEYSARRDYLSTNYEELSRLGNVIVKTTLEEIIMNSSVSVNKKKEEDILCVICQENMKENEVIRTMKCSHFFHIECIDQWLTNHKTCPVCNYRLGRENK